MIILTSLVCLFFFQAEDGIRDLVRSRGLGDVYKRQALIADGFRVTRIGSTGSFLRMGNSSLMTGVEDHQLSLIHI